MRKIRKLATLLLALVMVLGALPAFATTEKAETANVQTGIDPDEVVSVIVELEGETTLDLDDLVEGYGKTVGYSTNKTAAAYRADLVDQQNAVQSQISALVPDAQFRYHYTNVLNGFAARVQYKDIETIRSIAGVLNVYLTQSYTYDDGWDEAEVADSFDAGTSTLSDIGSVEQMGLQSAWDKGYTGAGKIVAVFDSSLRHTHELFNYMDPKIVATKPGNFRTKKAMLEVLNANKDSLNLFTSGWGSWFHQREEMGFSDDVQAAILNGDFYHNDKLPFAVDYMDGDLEVWDGDTSSHGTHVSGITTGNMGPLDPSRPVSIENTKGVLGGAYDAQLMFFKIFSEYDDYGQESDEAVFAAMDDAVTIGVNAFNLSLGIPNGFNTMNTYAQAGYQKAYNRAARAGISLAISAGNDARDNHNGSTGVNGYTTVLPNSSSLGFSTSLFGPMSVASASGAGYTRTTVTTVATVTYTPAPQEEGEEPTPVTLTYSLTDNNMTGIGETLTGSYDIVDVAYGSEEEILAATGATELAGALEGKVALVTRGGTPNFLQKGENVYNAGAVGMLMLNNQSRNTTLSAAQIYASMPTFGCIPMNQAANYTTAAAAGAKVSFATTSNTQRVNGNDNGPSSFTSWGVTESLRLKPDIMTPGGSIWSAGASSDVGLATMSGTSMASPNMEGAFILIQQYVDNNLDVFGVEPGTQEYTNLVNQLLGSNAKVYQPWTSQRDSTPQNLYFSPRRQGSGMARIDKIINSKVVLHGLEEYNPDTGEGPRNKVNLFELEGNEFDITFMLENFNSESRQFDVLACLQTDKTSTSGGRDVVASVNSYGTDIDPIADAVMTVASVSEGTIDTASENINRYNDAATPAIVTVPANSKVTVTVHVALNAETTAEREAHFPNGFFLEGYVFFESEDYENVNIPFMGFRGDWDAIPIFDFATIYDDISGKTTADLDYPLFNLTSLATLNGDEEVVLGIDQSLYDAEWPTFAGSGSHTRVRSYFNGARAVTVPVLDDEGNPVLEPVVDAEGNPVLVQVLDDEGNPIPVVDAEGNPVLDADGNPTYQMTQKMAEKTETKNAIDGELSVITPDGDGNADIVYANLTLLRNAKVIGVVITDAEGNIVKKVGADFDFFEAKSNDGNETQQVAATYGTKYKRDLAWDGTDDNGEVVEAGQYYYKVLAMAEYEFLNTFPDEPSKVTKEEALDALLASELVKTLEMPVKVEAEKATLKLTATASGAEIPDTAEFTITGEPVTGKFNDVKVTYADIKDGNYSVSVPFGTYKVEAAGADVEGYTLEATYSDDVVLTEENNEGTLTVTITYTKTEEPDKPDEPDEPKEFPFEDVKEGDWFNDDVRAVYEKGLMNGTGATTFDPQGTAQRAMVVTILYRIEGEPAVTAKNEFTDVEDGRWYTKAVIWATEAGITNGAGDGKFLPTKEVTRQELATFLYRYAQYKGLDLSNKADLSKYTDAASVAKWAKDAMAWANGNGIINGMTKTTLEPAGNATRAQLATMLNRFVKAFDL